MIDYLLSHCCNSYLHLVFQSNQNQTLDENDIYEAVCIELTCNPTWTIAGTLKNLPEPLAMNSCTSSSGATVVAPPSTSSHAPSSDEKVVIQIYDNGTRSGYDGSILSWIGIGGSERGNLLLSMEINLSKLKFIGSMQQLPNFSKALPMNTLFLTTEAGLYISEELDSLIQSNNKIPETGESRDEEDVEKCASLISEIKSSEILLSERRKIAEYKIKSLNKSYELNVQRSEKDATLKRLQTELNRINHEYKIEKALEENDLKILRKFVNIKDTRQRCEELTTEIADLEQKCRTKKEENLKVKFLFELRQLKLVSEIQCIYPIEKSATTNEYCIRGLELPVDLSTVDDDHVSSALSYVAHLLILLSKYLDIPLRYPIAYASSKSLIRDPLLIPMGGGVAATLPLYRRGVDREKFEKAVVLIQKNVKQLVCTVGLEYQNKKSWLENLNNIFQNQIWPIMEGESGM